MRITSRQRLDLPGSLHRVHMIHTGRRAAAAESNLEWKGMGSGRRRLQFEARPGVSFNNRLCMCQHTSRDR